MVVRVEKPFGTMVLVLAILITLPLAAAQAPPVTIDTVEWAVKPVKPGDTGVLKVVAVQFSEKYLLDATASIGGCGNLLEPLGTVRIGVWGPGERRTLLFPVKMLGKGDCSLVLKVSWPRVSEKSGFGYVTLPSGDTVTTTYPLRVAGSPLIRLYSDPPILVLNKVNNVVVTVRNEGGATAKGLRATLTATGLSPVDTAVPIVINAGDLPPGGEARLEVKVIPTQQVGQVTAAIEYVDEEGNPVSTSIVAPVYATGTGVLVPVLEPGGVEAGGVRKVVLKVFNTGDLDARDVKVRISPAQGGSVIVAPQLVELGEVRSLGSASAELEVTVPTNVAGPQPLQYEIVYRLGEGIVGREAGTLTLNVIAVTRLVVTSVDIVPSEPKVGSPVTVSISLLNTGTTPLSSINVSLASAEGLEPIRRTYSFLGRLEPQIPSSVAFSLNATSPGEHRLAYRIVFEDIYGRTHVLEKSVLVKVAGGEGVEKGEVGQRPEWLIYVLGGLGVVLAIVLAYAAIRWRK